MKRVIFVGLILSLLTFGFPAKTFSATEGCPDTWVLDSSKNQTQELIAAKAKYGPAMVVNFDYSRNVIEYAGQLGTAPELKNIEYLLSYIDPSSGQVTFYETWRWLMYLYGKSKIRIVSKVEIQGCLKPGYFDITYSFPTGGFNRSFYWYSPLETQQSRSQDWAKENLTAFKDFKAQESFSGLITQTTERIRKQVNEEVTYYNSDGKNGILAGKLLFSEPEFFGLSTLQNPVGNVVSLQVLTPDCLEIFTEKSQNEVIPRVYLRSGKTCKLSWSVNSFNMFGKYPNIQWTSRLTLLDEPFTINTLVPAKSIFCTKGKITKTIIGTNPKCPAGYKVKT
jgi:hypothetical protein